MTLTSIGDQSRTFMTRRLTARLRDDIGRLGEEMTTGRKALPRTPTTGDLTHLLGLRRDRTMVEAWQTSAREAGLHAGAVQQALSQVQVQVEGCGPGLAAAALSRSEGQIAAAAADAGARLVAAVSALNSRSGGMALFAGNATDGAALAAGDTMLAALRAAAAGETTAAGLAATIDTWFLAPGGGFETSAYLGGAGAPSARIGQGEVVTFGVNAADPALRRVLSALALAALAPQAGTADEQAATLERAGTGLIAAGDGVIGLRATAGTAEARIESLSARLAAEAGALGLAEAALVASDPYESATALEEATARLESMFVITGRLSRLSLAEYLR